MGDSVTSVGKHAFYNCKSLTSLTIPESVTSIEEFTFEGCTRLNITWYYNPTLTERSFISYLKNVIIPNSVTSIEENAFENYTRLTSVTIEKNITTIGNGAFQGCTSLTSINVASGNANYISDQGVLYNKNRTVLILFPKGRTDAFTIPDSVTSIGPEAFSHCTSLTSVNIPNSVTSIGDGAFSGCKFTSVTIPESVISIGNYAFFSGTRVTILDMARTKDLASLDYNYLTSVTFQGIITDDNFDEEAFFGDLRDKYLEGGKGTYTRESAISETWVKQ